VISQVFKSDAKIIIPLLVLPMILFLLAHAFLQVEQYQFKVETAIESQSGQQLSLPIFKFVGFDDGAQEKQLNVTLLPPAEARNKVPPSHVYFSFHYGNLKLSHNGEVFFDTEGRNIKDLPVFVQPLLIKLPTTYASGDPIKMEMSRNATNALRISYAYFGDADDFSPALKKHFMYYEVMGFANAGALTFTLLVLLILSLTRGFQKKEFRSLIFVIICMILFEISSIERVSAAFASYWQMLLLLGPLMVLASGKYVEYLGDGDVNLIAKRFFNLVVLVTITALALGALDVLNLRLVNFIFSVPLMLGFCLWATYKCVEQAKNTQRRMEIYAFAMAMFSFAISFCHDYLQRLGLVNDNVLLTQISFLTFFIVIAILAVLDNERTQRMIEKNNQLLGEALDDQSTQLKSEFQTRTILERAKVKAEEKLRFYSNLHDGVLGYLANIHAVSELEKSENSETIRKLSKNAINEIRVMMETDADEQEASLFRTCSALSQQIMVPLRAIGVDVKWNTLALLNYTTNDPNNNMEVFRILQEAIHNATNRAKCKELSIQASQNEAGNFTIEVANSGGQTYSASGRTGHGIANMRRRAKSIAAEFSIEPQDGGAIVRVILPN